MARAALPGSPEACLSRHPRPHVVDARFRESQVLKVSVTCFITRIVLEFPPPPDPWLQEKARGHRTETPFLTPGKSSPAQGPGQGGL